MIDLLRKATFHGPNPYSGEPVIVFDLKVDETATSRSDRIMGEIGRLSSNWFENGAAAVIDDPSEVYEQIMSPDTSLHYVAANVRVSIDMYKRIAGFDISQNPGITATLYNLGDAATRARELKAENDQRAAQGKPPLYPQENFYGWFVNEKEADLRALLN